MYPLSNQALQRKVPTAPVNTRRFSAQFPKPTENCWTTSTTIHLQTTGNVRHSVIELYLRHVQKHEQEQLLELELHDHKGMTTSTATICSSIEAPRRPAFPSRPGLAVAPVQISACHRKNSARSGCRCARRGHRETSPSPDV